MVLINDNIVGRILFNCCHLCSAGQRRKIRSRQTELPGIRKVDVCARRTIACRLALGPETGCIERAGSIRILPLSGEESAAFIEESGSLHTSGGAAPYFDSPA